MKIVELITPIVILPIMILDIFLFPIKWIMGVKTNGLADRWFDFEWKTIHKRVEKPRFWRV